MKYKKSRKLRNIKKRRKPRNIKMKDNVKYKIGEN